MTEMEHLDIRTVTLGLSLRDCCTASISETADRAHKKIEDRLRHVLKAQIRGKE